VRDSRGEGGRRGGQEYLEHPLVGGDDDVEGSALALGVEVGHDHIRPLVLGAQELHGLREGEREGGREGGRERKYCIDRCRLGGGREGGRRRGRGGGKGGEERGREGGGEGGPTLISGHHLANSRIQLPTVDLGTITTCGPCMLRASRRYAGGGREGGREGGIRGGRREEGGQGVARTEKGNGLKGLPQALSFERKSRKALD